MDEDENVGASKKAHLALTFSTQRAWSFTGMLDIEP